MRFDIITIFPHIFDFYFSESILGRAQKKRLIKLCIHDLRKWTKDKHRTVDDKPYGGGPGMIIKIEPIYRAITALKSQILNPKSQTNPKSKILNSKQATADRRSKFRARVILFSAKGKKFTQKEARRLSRYDQLILICGRYEGIDERVARYVADEELSVGDFVLTGGEIPAMILVDAVSRLKPGVLGKKESLAEESFTKDGFAEYPQYTRPEKFRGWKVPKILLSGNHKEIEEWRKGKSIRQG